MSEVIRVIDFETTGLEPPEGQVIEAAYTDLTRSADGQWSVGETVSWLCGVEWSPPETRAVHHISAADVSGLEPFDRIRFIQDSSHCLVLAAHNMEFEKKFLQLVGAVHVICTYKAALRVWPEAPAHSNGTLRYWLEDQGCFNLDPSKASPAHRAGPDTYVTVHILRELLDHATGRQMVAWSREPALLPTCPIGEWRGQPWSKVDAGFLNWMIGKRDMDADLKWNASRELDRRREAA